MSNLGYISEWFKIELKYLKEYKLNLYLNILISFIYTFNMGLFVYALKIQFGDLIYWNYVEIFFFIFFSGFVALSISFFYFNQNLSRYLLNGQLNQYLVKPKNVFLQYFVNSTYLFVGVAFIPYLVILIIFFIFNLEFFNLSKSLIVIFFGLFAGIVLVLFMRLFDSLAFYIKNNTFSVTLYQTPKGVFDRTPSIIFQDNLAKFALIFPNVYYNSIATNYYFGYINLKDLLPYLLNLIWIFIFCIIGISLLWKFGLKKYEGYN